MEETHETRTDDRWDTLWDALDETQTADNTMYVLMHKGETVATYLTPGMAYDVAMRFNLSVRIEPFNWSELRINWLPPNAIGDNLKLLRKEENE